MKKFLVVAALVIFQTLFAQVETAQKLIVAIAGGWDDSSGTLYLFDRSSTDWLKHRSTWNVSFGRAGLAWGIGLHDIPKGEYVKAEGDKRSPAGVFELGALYGLDQSPPEGIVYPYQPLTNLTRCVDDTMSKWYNRIVEEEAAVKDWESDEKMRRVNPDYKYLLVVKHNPGNEKGKGSCIFLHIVNTPTTGCTAMNEEDMLTLLRWLDPKEKTLVVQLPYAVYNSVRAAWNLPHLK